MHNIDANLAQSLKNFAPLVKSVPSKESKDFDEIINLQANIQQLLTLFRQRSKCLQLMYGKNLTKILTVKENFPLNIRTLIEAIEKAENIELELESLKEMSSNQIFDLKREHNILEQEKIRLEGILEKYKTEENSKNIGTINEIGKECEFTNKSLKFRNSIQIGNLQILVCQHNICPDIFLCRTCQQNYNQFRKSSLEDKDRIDCLKYEIRKLKDNLNEFQMANIQKDSQIKSYEEIFNKINPSNSRQWSLSKLEIPKFQLKESLLLLGSRKLQSSQSTRNIRKFSNAARKQFKF